jgi:cellulose synthase/poly-beta-1,6-N-acetylglucosamine synthase-like glycosyltransferase/peptidoglycan/xylan/chitin deacetylase (PgdA/CDA1 family)/spore germination protein YaaH
MKSSPHPIFYSATGKRWTRVVWLFRLGSFFAALTMIVALIAAARRTTTALPKLVNPNEVYKRVLNHEDPLILKSKQNAQFRNAATHLAKPDTLQRRPRHFPATEGAFGVEVRAGFYVNWDAESYFSLRENIEKMNAVFPEWFFIADSVDTVLVDIDVKALEFMRQHGVRILPMVSNYFNDTWNGAKVHRIIESPERRLKFIHSILNALVQHTMQGVNIDFEDLPEKSDEHLVVFQKELYEQLHRRGFLVTQDIAPLNPDYNLRELQKYNDYLVIMAYDQHFATSVPGPVAAHSWVESIVDRMTEAVPPDKLILGLPAYGYDWPQGSEGNDVTYQEALVTAAESEGRVTFDSTEYNLSYTYYDDNDSLHAVFFADAATVFNEMRTATRYSVRNFALWRLGSEDRRLWKFYARDLSDSGLAHTPFSAESLRTTAASTSVDFIGEGEILDIVASPEPGKIDVSFDPKEKFITGQTYVDYPSSYVIRRFGKAIKQVVLTFDDGPDPTYTPQILDILNEEHVPAAFFLVGLNAENNVQLVKRIYDEGHEIGNHTFTHPNLAEISPERTKLELNATRRIIESLTGHTTILFRPPYNADSEPQSYQELVPVEDAKRDDYLTIGESIDPEDWQRGISADTIVARIVAQERLGNIILLHDAGGDRSQTVIALPRIIRHFRDQGYSFTSVCRLISKTRDEVMPPLAQPMDRLVAKANWWIVEGIYWGTHILFALFFVGIVLSIGRILAMGILASLQRKIRKEENLQAIPGEPLVSIIVPAYNEEVNAVKTVNALLKSTYPALEIVFVDDGSTDMTYQLVLEAFSADPRAAIVTKPNGGKASALNYGIQRAKGEYVVCIDADTNLDVDAIGSMMKYFSDASVGAVAGNVKVGNENSILTRWQAIEYITSQNFDRRVFDLLNCITVVPGAIGAFRADAILRVGGFTNDTLAEDCDLTIRLLRSGYRVRYDNSAIARTEAPETFGMFFKQRFRWSFGIIQSLWKNRDALFNSEYGALGLAALPDILIYQIVLPFVSPLADAVMVVAIVTGNGLQVLGYYLLFLLIDAFGAIVAFSFEKEKLGRLWLLIPQRFSYRQMMYWVLFKSIVAAIRGQLVGWGVLQRTGKVKEAHT